MNLSEQQKSALRWAYCLTAPGAAVLYGDPWSCVAAHWLGANRTILSLVEAGMLKPAKGYRCKGFRITESGAKLRRSFL